MKVPVLCLFLLVAAFSVNGRPSLAGANDRKLGGTKSAECVFAALKEVGDGPPSDRLLGDLPSLLANKPERKSVIDPATYENLLKEWKSKRSEAIQKCLTADQVYDLGWFAFLRDKEFITSECKLYPTEMGTGDLTHGAESWMAAPTDRAEHPFYAGYDAAERKFGQSIEHGLQEPACSELLSGYGPEGSRFPGTY